jgi:hypothetical protein
VTLANHCAIPAIYEDQSSTSNAVRTAAARLRIGDRAGASPTCRGRPVSSLVVDMGAPPSCRAALIQAADRLTLELNCQGEELNPIAAASVMAARANHISLPVPTANPKRLTAIAYRRGVRGEIDAKLV